MKLSLIVAASINGAIGFKNRLPWKLPEDMKYFKEKTICNVVIMGGKTYESFKDKFPNGLPCRVNIVISRDAEFLEDVQNYDNMTFLYWVPNILSAINTAQNNYRTLNVGTGIKNKPEIFVMGGKSIYERFLAADLIDKIYYTNVHQILQSTEYDTTLSIDFSGFNLTSNEEGNKCSFQIWERDRSKQI